MSTPMKTFACLLLCLLTPFASADDMPNNIHQASSPIASAHYEIVVSSWMRKLTFRLDRYNGRVWIKVVNSKDDKLWESMLVEDHPWANNSTRAHFQIFLSGVFVSDTFLIDTDTGKTWTLVKETNKPGDASTDEHLSWQMIEDESKADVPNSPVKP